MRKTYKVYMVLEDGREVYLERYNNLLDAEARCRLYAKQDAYERTIGYHCPNTKYIVK